MHVLYFFNEWLFVTVYNCAGHLFHRYIMARVNAHNKPHLIHEQHARTLTVVAFTVHTSNNA